MDGHPVPKNVSQFEFHLVGDMTLKQFLYLAAGLATAYLTFILIAPKLPLIAWPIIIISASFGAAFAFLPIYERPLDHWAITFFKAIFNPTKRTWQSKNIKKDELFFKNRLAYYLLSFAPRPQNSTTPKITTIARFDQQAAPITATVSPVNTPTASTINIPAPQAINQPITPPLTTPPKQPSTLSQPQIPPEVPKTFMPPHLPSSEQLHLEVELAKQAQIIQTKIIETQNLINRIKAAAVQPGTNTTYFAAQLQLALETLSALNNQQAEISHKLALLAQTPISPTPKKVVVAPELASSKDTKITLTSTPNSINGIVTDNQGNYLDGVIIVTHDKQGLPVRALKSNKLGQFLAATPLPNGTYTITLEKEGFYFDTLEITLDGKVIPPISIHAKNL